MALLDDKERVIDLKLTQYGKYLLMKGRLKPCYYSFFDDDVLYDTQYAGFTEQQSSSSLRITSMPQFDAHPIFRGIESEIKKINKSVRSEKRHLEELDIPPDSRKDQLMSSPLGISSPGVNKLPSFEINFLIGTLSGSVESSSGSLQILQIPQLSSSVVYNIYEIPQITKENIDVEHKFQDNSGLDVRQTGILLEVMEHNVPFQNKNFDIEVYLVEGSGSNLVPLVFYDKKDEIENDILLDSKVIQREIIPDLSNEFVEYFLDITVDGEIDRKVLCDARNEKDKSKNVFYDDPLDCPIEDIESVSNIYEQFVEKDEGGECE